MSTSKFHLISLLLLGFCPLLTLSVRGEQFADRQPQYRIQQGDVVEVQYRFTPEYNATETVQPDGFIYLQLVGKVKVGGLTAEAAEQEIKQEASKRLRDPEVNVVLKEFVHPHYVVFGEVEHPGRFEMRGDVTALEAIAMSGGFKDSARHSQVVLVRKFNREYAQVSVLNLKSMISAGKVSENPELQPGDMLVVPQNTVSKLERYIRWSSLALYGIAIMVQ